LNRAQQQASTLINFVGTPTIAINGVVPVDGDGNPFTDPGDILAAMDSAIAAAEARRQQPEATVETTPEATEATEEATPSVTETAVARGTPTVSEEATLDPTEEAN
jgi:hypothetical protein